MQDLQSANIKGAHLLRSFFIDFLALFFFAGIFINYNKFEQKPIQSIRFAWPAELIEHLVLGYKLPAADFFWLRFIQDIDYKDKNLNGKTHLGWAYRMSEAITNLDHRYRVVYINAGTILSVGVEDAEGAQRLMEKGAQYFPHDWPLLYRLSYHFMYELKNCNKAAYYLNEAGKYGAPMWVSSLASRLYTHAAQYELAYRVILENLKRFENDEVMVKNLLERKAELDKARRGGGLPKDTPNQFAAELCQ